MYYEEIKQNALSLIKRAVEAKTNIIRISIADVTNIYFYSNEAESYDFQEQIDKEHGRNLCGVIYQAMSDVADPSFNEKQQQSAKITNKAVLPETVVSIDIKTYPVKDNFDMLFFINYEWTLATRDQIGTDLAIQAVQQLKEPFYILNSVLDISKPETLHNFERLKALLMMAYEEGFAKGARLGSKPE